MGIRGRRRLTEGAGDARIFYFTMRNAGGWKSVLGVYKGTNRTMPDNGDSGYEHAARLTVELVDHGHTPEEVSEAVLESLILMAARSKMDIWHREAGLSVASLAALYRLYETGAGYCHSRVYAYYELGRK